MSVIDKWKYIFKLRIMDPMRNIHYWYSKYYGKKYLNKRLKELEDLFRYGRFYNSLISKCENSILLYEFLKLKRKYKLFLLEDYKNRLNDVTFKESLKTYLENKFKKDMDSKYKEVTLPSKYQENLTDLINNDITFTELYSSKLEPLVKIYKETIYHYIDLIKNSNLSKESVENIELYLFKLQNNGLLYTFPLYMNLLPYLYTRCFTNMYIVALHDTSVTKYKLYLNKSYGVGVSETLALSMNMNRYVYHMEHNVLSQMALDMINCATNLSEDEYENILIKEFSTSLTVEDKDFINLPMIILVKHICCNQGLLLISENELTKVKNLKPVYDCYKSIIYKLLSEYRKWYESSICTMLKADAENKYGKELINELRDLHHMSGFILIDYDINNLKDEKYKIIQRRKCDNN